MELSDEKIGKYVKRLLTSRMRILTKHPFFGLLLMHLKFYLDENCSKAATDGERILFAPDFLESLSDGELDFIILHEIMHVALLHVTRANTGQMNEDDEWNMAADIVANSNILLENDMDLKSISVRSLGGVQLHNVPNGKEGYEYTLEEVYEMVKVVCTAEDKGDKGESGGAGGTCDDHSLWGEESAEPLDDLWKKRMKDAAEAIKNRSNSRGLVPAFAERMLKELKNPQTDWRTILISFIQEEVTDYSFSPPDRRFDDSPFFLPDYNEKEDTVKDILFMIDTSGSMSDKMVTAAYSEVKGAIDQFNGKLRGWLGFFDAAIVEPKPFEDEETFKIIRPKGGGGNENFGIIFKYVSKHMDAEPPASIVILTDGYAPFPDEKEAGGIPVLWLLNNEDVKPPWGKIARVEV